MDIVRDLAGPGLIFLVLCIWLVRKAIKAARTESDLESERLLGSLAEELQRGRDNARASQRPQLVAVTPPEDQIPVRAPLGAQPATASPGADSAGAGAGLAGADSAGAVAEHLAAVAALIEEREAALVVRTPQAARRRVQVLWVRSASGHVAWCERRHPTLPQATLVRDLIFVARIEDGRAVERWSFG